MVVLFDRSCLALRGVLDQLIGPMNHQQSVRCAVPSRNAQASLPQDMHDTVIQGCVGASTLLEAAAGFAGPEDAQVMEFLDRARIQLRLTLDEARQALTDLRRLDSFADRTG